MVYCATELHCVHFLFIHSLLPHVQLTLKVLKCKFKKVETHSCFKFYVFI
jgi:hypothetical protein